MRGIVVPELLHPLALGNLTLRNNLVLSPMAGYSDLPFRILCRRAWSRSGRAANLP